MLSLICVCVSMCACECAVGSQRSIPGVVSWAFSTLVFWDRVSLTWGFPDRPEWATQWVPGTYPCPPPQCRVTNSGPHACSSALPTEPSLSLPHCILNCVLSTLVEWIIFIYQDGHLHLSSRHQSSALLCRITCIAFHCAVQWPRTLCRPVLSQTRKCHASGFSFSSSYSCINQVFSPRVAT